MMEEKSFISIISTHRRSYFFHSFSLDRFFFLLFLFLLHNVKGEKERLSVLLLYFLYKLKDRQLDLEL